jgi:hypothetical protein
LSHENAQMIWELLQETDIYNNIGHQEKIEIRSQFTKNMRAFNDKHTMSSLSLIERNKLFIGVVLNEHRRANIAESKQPKRSPFPTSKDVQEERRQVFDQDLQRRKNEFENSMSTSKPELPSFQDKMDEPISQMEDLISRTIASRELETSQIFKSMSSSNAEPVWLQETSVKSEKALKQIKIEKEDTQVFANGIVEDIIDLNSKPVTRNKVRFLNEESNVMGSGLSLENPLSKFKKLPSLDSKPVVELSDKPTNEPNDVNYAQLSVKMDVLDQKLDYLIGLLKGLDLTAQVPNDQTHPHAQPNNHRL